MLGVCMAGEMVTEEGSIHPTGMHSCFGQQINSRIKNSVWI